MISRTDANYGFGIINSNAETRAERFQQSSRDENVSFKKLLQDRFERSGATFATATATYSRTQAGGNRHSTQANVEHLHALKSSNAYSATAATNTNVVTNAVSETEETTAPKINPPVKSSSGITEFLNTHLGLNINPPVVMGTPGFTEISYVGKRNLTEFYDGITNIANALMEAAEKGESLKFNGDKTLTPEEAREIAALLQETVGELKTELENTKIIGGRRLKHPDASEEPDSLVIRLWKDFYARHREPTGITEEGKVQDMLANLIDSLNLYKHNVSDAAFNEFNEKIERAIEQGLIS